MLLEKADQNWPKVTLRSKIVILSKDLAMNFFLLGQFCQNSFFNLQQTFRPLGHQDHVSKLYMNRDMIKLINANPDPIQSVHLYIQIFALTVFIFGIMPNFLYLSNPLSFFHVLYHSFLSLTSLVLCLPLLFQH